MQVTVSEWIVWHFEGKWSYRRNCLNEGLTLSCQTTTLSLRRQLSKTRCKNRRLERIHKFLVGITKRSLRWECGFEKGT